MRIMYVLVLILMVSCKNETSGNAKVTDEGEKEAVVMPTLEVYDFEGLKPFLKTSSETVYVVNFWATWCAPCIKEMPYFEALNTNYKDKNVEVLLVSLDFPKKYDSHLKPFIKKNKLKSRVVVLNDPDSNTWIPEINPDWSGAIPATLIFSKDKRAFYEQPFTYEELETELQKFIN
ncbi:TlpA disulfide reductase family protein [uncultured Gelidibacter sp.]|uniref:TlpA family protein disulfide reductase n=1 Tax=uncultured Gelidibacter sp. TaxID=259318 RepID=UPI0026259245|nr:TlpA disulfide reductase family protein [uncultured Gelidibacter sp.]